MNLATVLHEYGYPAVFFGVMLEGESVWLAAAYGIDRHFLAIAPRRFFSAEPDQCAGLGAAGALVGAVAGARAPAMGGSVAGARLLGAGWTADVWLGGVAAAQNVATPNPLNAMGFFPLREAQQTRGPMPPVQHQARVMPVCGEFVISARNLLFPRQPKGRPIAVPDGVLARGGLAC